MDETRRDYRALATCFSALIEQGDELDRETGLIRLAEFVNRVCTALTKK